MSLHLQNISGLCHEVENLQILKQPLSGFTALGRYCGLSKRGETKFQDMSAHLQRHIAIFEPT